MGADNMIYMVEHTIGMPEMEGDWNAWYSGYLKVLMKVPGFLTTQRFHIPGSRPSRYMAMYTVESGDVFESAAYKSGGGGGTASERFRPAYQSWRRNLFATSRVPAVAQDQVLVIADSASPGATPFEWWTTVGLHKTTPYRGVAVLSPDAAVSLVAGHSNWTVYTPLTSQLVAGQA